MCTFEFTVELCGCESAACKQRKDHYIDKNLRDPGHVMRITQMRRISGICIDWFINNNPNRTVIRWGLPADSANSTQDCKGAKKFTFNKDRQRTKFCDECLRTCEQPGSVARLVRSNSEGAKLQRQKRGLEKKEEDDEPSEEQLEALDEEESRKVIQRRLKAEGQG